MRLAHRWRRGCARRRRRGTQEDGFILLESVIAISLITVLMGALASLTINVVTGTSELRARQGATQLATSAMAGIAAVPPTDLVTGRDTASVSNQFAIAPASVSPWLASMSQVSDTAAPLGAGATAVVSTAAVPQTLSNVDYRVTTYLGSCRLVGSAPLVPSRCETTGTGTTQLRAVVAVTWSGRGCRSASCAFVTATLVNTDPDPVFNTAATLPPKPTVAPPGDQLSTRGTVVSLQLTASPGTGVAPLTWQLVTGVLPTGLTLSGTGLIAGTPSTVTPAAPLTVSVSDVFGRTGTATFSWRVVDPPTITTPPAQTGVQGQAVSLTVASTCPNAPCVYAATGLPSGLSINAGTGVISGTPTGPTAPGGVSVTVSVTDSDGAVATTSAFTWTVFAPATIATPAPLRTSVGAPVSVPVAYTCPVGPCTVTLTGTVPGVGLSQNVAAGSPNTATTLTLPTGSGTVYLTGLVQAAALPSGTSRAYGPTLRIAGASGPAATSASADWTVVGAPTIGAVGSRNVTVGTARDVPVAYTCSITPCTVTLTNPVPGLGLSATAGRTGNNTTTSLTVSLTSGTFYISGTVAAGAVPSGSNRPYALTASIVDDAGSTASSSGTWTATTTPKLTNPGSQAVEPNRNVRLPIAAECPNGGCTWRAEVLYFGLFWLSVPIDSSGTITYANVPAGSYTVRVTVTDSEGLTDTTSFPLTAQTFSLSIPDQTTRRPSSGTTVATLDVASLVRPTAGAYTYTISGAPGWLTLDETSGLLTATATPNGPSNTNTITVTATSTASSASTVSETFTWRLS